MPVIEEHLSKSMDYAAYRALIQDLLEQNKSTGTHQSDDLTAYSRMNDHRMNRWDKTYTPSEAIVAAVAGLSDEWIWLVLTEGWCGDAAQNIPLLHKISQLSEGKIIFRLLLRDENLDLMDEYLTNGGRAIPKLICLRAHDLKELGTWGPRPAPAQAMVMDFKQKPYGDYKKFAEEVHGWYARDKAQTFNQEILESIRIWEKMA